MKVEILKHRVNDLPALEALLPEQGAEIDLRVFNGEIILQHDPFLPGLRFEDFLRVWASKAAHRGTLALNVKEDGLELELESRLLRAGFTASQYFFLDCAPPTFIRRTREKHQAPYAVRYSEFEPAAAAMVFANQARWVWVDSFCGEAPPIDDLRLLAANFQVCLVSPELQGYPGERISNFTQLIPYISAVCTKHPELWRAEIELPMNGKSHEDALDSSFGDCAPLLQRS